MKFTSKKMVEQALENIRTLQEHQKAVQAALYRAREMGGRGTEVDSGSLYNTLMTLELTQWRNLFMFGMTLDGDEKERIQAAAVGRFLSDKSYVGNYITNQHGDPTSYYTADEEEFRKMVKESFFKKDSHEQE
jgi:hypothetical protein